MSHQDLLIFNWSLIFIEGASKQKKQGWIIVFLIKTTLSLLLNIIWLIMARVKWLRAVHRPHPGAWSTSCRWLRCPAPGPEPRLGRPAEGPALHSQPANTTSARAAFPLWLYDVLCERFNASMTRNTETIYFSHEGARFYDTRCHVTTFTTSFVSELVPIGANRMGAYFWSAPTVHRKEMLGGKRNVLERFRSWLPRFPGFQTFRIFL